MTNEKKQDYTLRISQSNPTQLLVILYEMYEDYIDDAISAGREDRPAFREGIRKGRLCLNQLIGTLDMEYELSNNLLRIYLYITKEMARADVAGDIESLKECKKLIGMLRSAYDSISDQDKSGPVMENSQTVYSGLTYGRGASMESSVPGTGRGYLV